MKTMSATASLYGYGIVTLGWLLNFKRSVERNEHVRRAGFVLETDITSAVTAWTAMVCESSSGNPVGSLSRRPSEI